jgi:hypothetical protein
MSVRTNRLSGFIGRAVPPARARGPVRDGVRGRLARAQVRSDAGQALVLALIIMLILAIVPEVVVSEVVSQSPLATTTINSETALAAAEGGIQEYRNLLDLYPDYWQYSAAKEPGAVAGGPNAAFTSYVAVPDLPAGNPPEFFTYTPDTSDLTATGNGKFDGDVLLQVIGMAGSGASATYRRLVASFSLSGVLTDSYFSNYEQPGVDDVDQWAGNTYQCQSGGWGFGGYGGYGGGGCSCPSYNCTAVTSGTNYYAEITTDVSFEEPGSSGMTSEPAAQALCEYDSDQVNAYVDWYSYHVAPVYPPNGYPNQGTAYSPSNPYYGPWYSAWQDPTNPNLWFGNGPAAIPGDSPACLVNYWVTGDSFTGPVYSQDELTTCGSPSFTSLSTAISKNFNFPAGWPGTEPAVTNGQGQQVSYPYGYIKDPYSECSGGPPGSDTPTIAAGQPQFGVTQSLPPVATELESDIEKGTTPGCVYTGPTLIRFYYDPTTSSEEMEVWSPLTKDTYASGGVQCGSFTTEVSSSNQVLMTGTTLQTVPVSRAEVLYVQSLPTTPGDPNYWAKIPTAEANATVSGCIDPWIPPGPASSATTTACTEGDVVVGGVVGGQVTVASAASIIVGHSLGYSCALGSGSQPTISSSISGCATSTDVTGLVAAQSIWLAHGVTSSGGEEAMCTDDYDMAPGSMTIADLLPDQCDLQDPVIDAAMAALQGFFEVQNWTEGNRHGGTVTVNGSDAVNNAGQFGEFQGSGPGLTIIKGYALALNYDSRLRYLTPPDYVQATASVWDVVGWVTCGNSVGYSFGSPPTPPPLSCSALG